MQADLSKNSPRKRKLKTLQQQKRRQKVKINGLNSIIKTLSNFCQKKPVKICLSNFLVHPKLLLKMISKITNLKEEHTVMS